MKKILIEMERLRDLNSGLGQFCLGLGKAITEKAEELNINFYLPKKAFGIFGENQIYHPVSKLDKFLGIGSKDFAICHCTHQLSDYLPKNKKTKLILTIHDLNFLYKYRSEIKKSLKTKQLQHKINRASALVFISRFTEMEIRKYLTIPDIPTKVIYNGNTLKTFEGSKVNGIPEGKYLFAIGIVQPKKNFHTLISLLNPNKDLKLVIAGRQDEDYVALIKQKAHEQGVSDKVILTGSVDDETRFHLFKNCYAFVFPSLSEGFGLPVIEAMSLGKPVFLSPLTSLPEIGGAEAFYFDGFEPENMRKTFESGMTEYNNDHEKANRIKKWAAKFTWELAAEEYLKLYRQIL